MIISELYNEFYEKMISDGTIESRAGVMMAPARKVEAYVKKHDPELFDRISRIRDGVTFTRRKYGVANFYCWAHSAELQLPQDPWPAANFPKAVLFVDIALILEREQLKKSA